ncbi:MAG: replication protein, partial [Candidatus Aenigmarchaeota archaeon]|nr:replication protein [Candidatus Aenigmarchaeota archaeon]
MITKIDMDNGNYPYAKDIGRVLAKTKLNSSHRGIIDAVLDKTYGWHDNQSKKEKKIKQRKTHAKIDFKFFEEFTGTPFCKLSIAIKDLVKWKIIKREKQGRSY